MQQTEKLKLNLIETGDPISPVPINENTQALDGLVAGLVTGPRVFKLAEVPPLPEDGPISFDLSGVDMTQYDALLMIVSIKYIASSTFMKINGAGSVAVVHSISSSRADALSEVLFLPFGDKVVARVDNICFLCNGSGTTTPTTMGGRFDTPWADVHTITAGGNACEAGSGGVIFGLKF